MSEINYYVDVYHRQNYYFIRSIVVIEKSSLLKELWEDRLMFDKHDIRNEYPFMYRKFSKDFQH